MTKRLAVPPIPLRVWAQRRFGEYAPVPRTLYRWVRDAKILPRPELRGHTYYVSPNAEYVDQRNSNYDEKVAAALDEQATQ